MQGGRRLELSLCLLAAKKMAIIVSWSCRFGRTGTAQFCSRSRSAGAAAVCEAWKFPDILPT